MTTEILIGLAALGVSLLGKKKEEPKLTKDSFDSFFYMYADDPRLAKAVAKVESDLNPGALGDQGKAFGLMQIWYPTAQGYGYEGEPYGLLDPETNIKIATRFLNHMVSKYGRQKGTMAYNLGETKIRKGVTHYAYLEKVEKAYQEVRI